MKVISESEWQQIKSDLVKDPDERAKKMLEFVVAWAETAETLLSLHDNYGDHLVTMPMVALRRSLEEAEVRSGVTPPTMELGQALLILCSVWEPAASDRDQFVASMGSIERHLFSEVAVVWEAHQQRQAQQQETVR